MSASKFREQRYVYLADRYSPDHAVRRQVSEVEVLVLCATERARDDAHSLLTVRRMAHRGALAAATSETYARKARG